MTFTKIKTMKKDKLKLINEDKLIPRQKDEGYEPSMLKMQKHLTMKPNTQSVLNDIFEKRIVLGWPELKIKHYLMDDTLYGYSERTAQRYLVYLREYIVENSNIDKQQMMASHIAQLEEMAFNLKTSNPKLYLHYIQEINKLLGLYEPQKVDITTGGEKINKITIEIIGNDERS